MTEISNVNLGKISPIYCQPQQAAQNEDVECCKYLQNTELMPKECTQASRAYALSGNNIEKPIDLKDYVQILKQKGIDYDVDTFDGYNGLLDIKNKNGQTVKTLHYDGGLKAENLSCYEVMYYDGKSKDSCRELGFDIGSKTPKWINNDYKDVPQESFTDCGLTVNTKMEDYVSYLKSQGKIEGIDYIIENEVIKDEDSVVEENNVLEIDKNGKKVKNTLWYSKDNEYCFNFQSYYDKDEFLYKRITFEKDGLTSVCDYYNKENR